MNTSLSDTDDLSKLRLELPGKPWLVACLCAAWCNTCGAYRAGFDALREQHPDKCFAWIDIEDQSHLVDDIDVENFPTLLVQHEDRVLFLGTMLPDARQLHRLLQTLSASSASAASAPEDWSLRRAILQDA
jgi:hypothetical protein